VTWLLKNFPIDGKFDPQKIQQAYNPADIEFPENSVLTETFQLLQDSCKQANFDFLGSPKLNCIESNSVHQPQVHMEVDTQEAPTFQYKHHADAINTGDSNNNNTLVQLPSLSPVSSSSNSPSYVAMMAAIRDDLDEDAEDRLAIVKTKFMCDSLGQTVSVVRLKTLQQPNPTREGLQQLSFIISI